MERSIEVVLIAGPYEGALGMAWGRSVAPELILVGMCTDVNDCRSPWPDGSHDAHVWFWLPQEHRPHDAVVYRLVEQEDGEHWRAAVQFDGLARYVHGDAALPESRAEARGVRA